MPYQAEPKTYGDVVSQYRWHPEAKSLASDGGSCKSDTSGLLQRTPVTADGFRYIGKETDRHWEQGEDISMLDPTTLEYHPNETAKLVTVPVLQHRACQVSIRSLAKSAGVSDKTVKAIRKGKRMRRSTIARITKALGGANRRAGRYERARTSVERVLAKLEGGLWAAENYANKRPSGSVRGATSDGCPYRDRQQSSNIGFTRRNMEIPQVVSLFQERLRIHQSEVKCTGASCSCPHVSSIPPD
jgi:DNA-binding Xre family transcriptional regulator